LSKQEYKFSTGQTGSVKRLNFTKEKAPFFDGAFSARLFA